MNDYTITHGSIAAVQYVDKPDGTRVTVVGMTSELQPEFEALPLAVRAAVNRQFGDVFSLPYNKREDFCKNSVPFVISVV